MAELLYEGKAKQVYKTEKEDEYAFQAYCIPPWCLIARENNPSDAKS